ncbi:MAG: helix-turn-helix domain-containing protein [Candidatus Pacebacteria bacterium]|nr:helix-turn-helix domain-containing protein [Candidatus Paceibacterota bacterium]
MKKDLEIKAKKLRGKGYSINELSRILMVSKSTISKWVNNIDLSSVAIKRIENNYSKGQIASQKTIKEKTQKKNMEADTFALNKLKNINLQSGYSLLLCSMIYQCEGSKSIKDSITFTNSDPELMRTFLYLFRKSFHLDENKFRVLMHLHGYHNESIQKKFWSEITGISSNQFLKTFNKPSTGVFKKEGYQGCIQVRYRDVKIGRIINAVAKKFMERYK